MHQSSFRPFKAVIHNIQIKTLVAICGLVLLSSCGGGGSSGGGQNGNNNSTPVALGPMKHEITYDPKSDTIPTAVGTVANTNFGAVHDNVQVVFNSTGEGMAIWQVDSGTDIKKIVYAVYDSVGKSWGSEDTLFVITNFSSTNVEISLAASNDKFAVAWKVPSVYEVTPDNQTESNSYNYAKIYQNGNWSASMLLNAGIKPTTLSAPVVSSDGTSFMFVWEENFALAAREWTSSMSDPEPIYSFPTVFNTDMELISNGSGYMLKMEETASNYTSSFMTTIEYKAGAWQTAVTTEANAGTLSKSKIATDGTGYLMTWVQSGATQYRYFDGGSWTDMAPIAESTTAAHHISSNGNGYLLSWVTSGDLYVKPFSAGNWGSAVIADSIADSISSINVTATETGYAFAIRTYDSIETDYDLYLQHYGGGASGTAIPLEATAYDVETYWITHGDGQTWVIWNQYDGNNQLLNNVAYQDDSVAVAQATLNSNQHSSGVKSGKVATTSLGIKVAAWSQAYLNSTGGTYEAAYARANDTGEAVFLRNYSSIRDVVAIGETIIVILDASDGIAVVEYDNGVWGTVTSLTGSFVYDWDYKIANNRMMIMWENVNDIRASVYDSGSWSTVTKVDIGSSNGYPELATNGADFMVTWREFLPTNTTVTPNTYPGNINARFYDASLAQWQSVVLLENYEAIVGGFSPQIVSNGDSFLIAWTRAQTTSETSETSLFSSECDASGVCAAVTPLEDFTTSIGGLKLASDNTGYMIAFTSNYEPYYVVNNGTSWASPAAFTASSSIYQLINDGSQYMVLWVEDANTSALNISRYSVASGWSSPDVINASGDYFVSLELIKMGSEYAITWRSLRPDHDYSIYDLNLVTSNGTAWNTPQIVNTGKFSVDDYSFDLTNNTLRLSWVQAHESNNDPAAPALWEYLP